MSDSEYDRKRKAGEIDSTAVAPKKKLAAQAAMAAAEAAGGSSSVTVKLEAGKPSYSIEETAPCGANAADSEEVVRFQNGRLYAALEAKKHEISRLQTSIDGYAATEGSQQAAVACITRHWCALMEELKGGLHRLQDASSPSDTELPPNLLEQMAELKSLVPENVESTMKKSCAAAQDLMREVVKSLTNADLRLKAGLDKMESAAGDADIKAEIEQTKERLMTLSKGLDKMQETHRDYVIGEGIKMDEVRTKAARVTELEQETSELRRQCEQAERRLVLSEQNLKSARQTSSSPGAAAVAAATADPGGQQKAHPQHLEYKVQAENRLEEIKGLQKQILQLQDQAHSQAALQPPQELNDDVIKKSQPYVILSEQLKAVQKEVESYHMAKINQLTMEIQQEKEKQQSERQMIENQHNQQIQQLLKQLQVDRNQVLEAKQEVRSLQFKLDQKSVGEISTKRAEELNETLQKVQTEYQRLKKEHEMLKARPDAEDLRREFREEKEKLWKERDTELHKAADLADQVKEKDKKIEELLAVPKGDGANGVNGVETALQKEIAGLKADVTKFREEKRDLSRRLQKADRGFNECNKLYQQFKKDKEETMKDLESLGHSFEEMQEQNTRLLQTMKQRDEDYNDLLKERIKERQQREMLTDEKTAMKLKLDKTEELLKAREDNMEMIRKNLEHAELEQSKRNKEEECSAAILAEHRKLLQVRESQAKDARRDLDKSRTTIAELQKAKHESDKELQELKFEKTRLQEDYSSAQRRLSQMEKMGGSSGGSLDHGSMELLKHYRSCIKCHCNGVDAIKDRVLPCGHASCKQCIDKLIQGRNRKCPQCSQRFDQSDVKQLHLQSSLGD